MKLPALLVLLVACRSTEPAAQAPAVDVPVATAPVVETPAPAPTFTLDSKILGETRRLNVYVPPGYTKSDTRYPILYMPDGGREEDFPHVAETVDKLVRAGKMRPVIVVGIENTERRRDLTGPTDNPEDRKIAPRVGGSAAFRAFMRDELVPEVARRVRGSSETAIIGESLAGLFIVETLLLEPGLFDHYIAFSPSLWWNDQALVKASPEKLAALPAGRSLWLSIAGDDDRDGAVYRFAELAGNASKLSFVFAPMPGEQHATIYRAAEGPALARVFARE